MNCVDLNYSLQIRAAAAYAVSLWEKPDVKKLIIEDCDYTWRIEGDLGDLSVVVEKIVKEIFCTNLPESLCLYVVHVVKSMATNLRSCTKFLRSEYDLKINITDAIQWTSTGTIDEVKVFEKWLLDHSMIAQYSKDAYCMAYRCVHLKFLFQHSKHIQELSVSRVYDPLRTFVIVLSMKSYIQNKYFSGGPKMIFKELEWKICNLFCSAVQQSCFLVTRFCWNEMTEEDRKDYCMDMGNYCVELFQKSLCDDFCLEQYVKIMIFLMSKMSADEMKKFLESKKCKILAMVLTVWPEINLFLPLFENVKEMLSISEFAKILLDIISHFDQRNGSKLNYSECFYFELFKRAYYSFCKCIKKNLPDNFSTNLTDVIKKLFKICHVPGLRLILESRLFKDCKHSLSVIREVILEEIFDKSEFSLMDLLLREIFNANNELEKSKLILQFFDYLIKSKEYYVANMFLMLLDVQRVELWRENRQDLVNNQINLVDLFKILIFDDEFDVAENLLNWVLETEEEKENIKIFFSNEEIVKTKIYSIWALETSYEKRYYQNYLSDFFRLLFKSEIQIDLFKKEKLIKNRNCVAMFLKECKFSSSIAESLQKLEDFINFCEIANDKIAEIKNDLRENLINIIMFNQKIDFFLIHCFINWCTENDEQKKETIKKLMMSVDIISLWDKIDDKDSEIVTFCNEWIRESEDIAKLKDEILRRNKSNNYYRRKWEYVFEKLIRGDEITVYDIDLSFYEDDDYSHRDIV